LLPGSRVGFAFGRFQAHFIFVGRWLQGVRRCSLMPFFLGPGILTGLQHFVRNIESVQAAQLDRHVFINRAGVRLFLADTQLRKPVEDLVSFDFQLPRQLVDTNLLHREKAICF
jgi:hypothetical protein